MAYNPTKSTWSQVANEQAYKEFTAGALNSKQPVTQYDPIYNKLVAQISYTMYRKYQVNQNWRNLGRNAPMNTYPGILREIIMTQRKGQNFSMDNTTRPTTLGSYDIYDDTIDVRYHSAQYRWMYPWTIYDEELRRYSGGDGRTIAELAEMKMINCISARNMFMDNLRKQTLATLGSVVATPYYLNIDITDFSSLTQAQAQEWLNEVDNLLFMLQVGTSLYNGTGNYMQTPKSDLQMVMPRAYFMAVVRKAFPDTYNTQYFENILPANLILIDTLGGDTLYRKASEEATAATAVNPTFDSHGMNLLNYQTGDTFQTFDDDCVAMIIHRDSMGFEDNLNETLFGMKDIEKLATPVRSHFWTKAYYTDLLPAIKIINGSEPAATAQSAKAKAASK